jgi:hypothetical protein
MLHNIPEEQRPQLHHSSSLKYPSFAVTAFISPLSFLKIKKVYDITTLHVWVSLHSTLEPSDWLS